MTGDNRILDGQRACGRHIPSEINPFPSARVVRHVCDPFIARLPDAESLKDPKTRLQEWLQGHGYSLPEYTMLSEEGPPHRKVFLMQCVSETVGFKVTGKSSSRRKAEQLAALAALEFVANNDKK